MWERRASRQSLIKSRGDFKGKIARNSLPSWKIAEIYHSPMLPLPLQLSAVRAFFGRILRQFPWGVWTYINKETDDCSPMQGLCQQDLQGTVVPEKKVRTNVHFIPIPFDPQGSQMRASEVSLCPCDEVWNLERAWMLHQHQVTMCAASISRPQSCPTLRRP